MRPERIGRYDRDECADHRCHAEGDSAEPGIEGETELSGIANAGGPYGNETTEQAASGGNNKTLHHHQAHDVPAAGADTEADGHLTSTGGGLHQERRSHVETGDQHNTGQQHRGEDVGVELLVAVGATAAAEEFVELGDLHSGEGLLETIFLVSREGTFCFDRRDEGVEFGLRFLDLDTGFDPADDGYQVSTCTVDIPGIQRSAVRAR